MSGRLPYLVGAFRMTNWCRICLIYYMLILFSAHNHSATTRRGLFFYIFYFYLFFKVKHTLKNVSAFFANTDANRSLWVSRSPNVIMVSPILPQFGSGHFYIAPPPTIPSASMPGFGADGAPHFRHPPGFQVGSLVASCPWILDPISASLILLLRFQTQDQRLSIALCCNNAI